MKKFITISALFLGASIPAMAIVFCPNAPQTEIVSLSQKGGAASAEKIMQIQAKEGLDVARDSFLIYQLASCEGAIDTLLAAAKKDNAYAIKALKMMKLADAEDTLLGLVKAKAKSAKDALDALSACGSEKTLNFLLDGMAKAGSLIGDYVKTATELYRALPADKQAECKKQIDAQASSADAKVKSALERVTAAPVAKAKK
ncbi:MAG: hypothetical protein R3Y46_03875 [Opitutales bacterium]